MFQEKPISSEVEKRRWLLFGHILRMPHDAPAQRSLGVFLNPSLRNRRGRPKITLFSTLVKDVFRNLGMPLKNMEHLKQIRGEANDRQKWIDAFTHSEDVAGPADDIN